MGPGVHVSNEPSSFEFDTVLRTYGAHHKYSAVFIPESRCLGGHSVSLSWYRDLEDKTLNKTFNGNYSNIGFDDRYFIFDVSACTISTPLRAAQREREKSICAYHVGYQPSLGKSDTPTTHIDFHAPLT